MMQYSTIPGIDKKVSRLIQGTVMVASKKQDYSFGLLDEILELGCTTFDTAHVYGNGDNERTVGAWVNDRGVREQVVILGKGAHHSGDRKRVTPFDITADLHDSLARFKFDYIDLYLLHRDDPDVPVGPIVEQLHAHKEAGLINAYGGSNWSAERVKEANEYAAANGLTPFAVTSPHYSLAEMIEAPWDDCLSIAGPGGEEAREWYNANNVTICCWSSLSGGFWSGRLNRANADEHKGSLHHRCYLSDDNLKRLDRVEELAQEKGLNVPQVALAFVLNQPFNVHPLVGCESKDEFKANMDILEIKLAPEELDWLDLKRDDR
jgi:aryl-alcohol dehydrogenase-like predicted oxidoreductase